MNPQTYADLYETNKNKNGWSHVFFRCATSTATCKVVEDEVVNEDEEVEVEDEEALNEEEEVDALDEEVDVVGGVEEEEACGDY